jgi:hypothetical protein
MALSTTTRKVIFNGNGSATVFPYTFPIPAASCLSVIYTDDADVETTLSSSEYTVTGIGSASGGNVTYTRSGSAIASGTKLTIVRTVPYTQLTVLSNQGGYYPEIVEGRFDLVYMALQQLAEIVERYTVSSISDPTAEQSNYALIQALQQMDLLTTDADLLTRVSGAYARLARGNPGQYLGVSGGGALQWQTPSSLSFSGVRQTVSAGPVTSAGLPSLLPSTTTATLNLTSQNVSSTYPLVATAAGGWSNATGGPVDTIGYSTTNLTWTGLTASRAAATPNFLYVTISGGTMTPGKTLLAPIYQWGGTPSTTSGQFTFNISEMRGYLGNGTTAPQVNLVFVGEAATDGSAVISTVAYAYSGRYESGYTDTLPSGSTAVSRDHNIGAMPRVVEFRIQNKTSEAGYAVGDDLGKASLYDYDGANIGTAALCATARTASIIASSTPWLVRNKSTGAQVTLTAANWKYRIIAERGW